MLHNIVLKIIYVLHIALVVISGLRLEKYKSLCTWMAIECSPLLGGQGIAGGAHKNTIGIHPNRIEANPESLYVPTSL